MNKEELKNNILENITNSNIEANGWDMMPAAYFTDLGFDKDFIKTLITTEKSGSGKYQLYGKDGKAVNSIRGVYYLNFLERCSNIISPDFTSSAMGRGFRAKHFLTELRRKAKTYDIKFYLVNDHGIDTLDLDEVIRNYNDLLEIIKYSTGSAKLCCNQIFLTTDNPEAVEKLKLEGDKA